MAEVAGLHVDLSELHRVDAGVRRAGSCPAEHPRREVDAERPMPGATRSASSSVVAPVPQPTSSTRSPEASASRSITARPNGSRSAS